MGGGRDGGQAVRELNWNPRFTSFEQLVSEMVQGDIVALSRKSDRPVDAQCPVPEVQQ